MSTAFDRINAEFAHISRTVDNLSTSLAKRSGLSPPMDSNDYFEDVAIFASAVEHIYTACERVMEIAAREIDSDRIEHAENWHRSLLDRMAAPFGRRAPIISSDCFEALNRLRAFRHRERSSYIETLDRALVIERAREAIAAFKRLRVEFRSFEASYRH